MTYQTIILLSPKSAPVAVDQRRQLCDEDCPGDGQRPVKGDQHEGYAEDPNHQARHEEGDPHSQHRPSHGRDIQAR